MPSIKIALATIALSLGTLAPVVALESTSAVPAPQGSVVPAVITAAYGDPRIVKTPADAFRQGGFAVAGATRWVATPRPETDPVAFVAPGVISAGYVARNIGTSASRVASQGGYRVAGAVRWTATPDTEAAEPETVRLGAL